MGNPRRILLSLALVVTASTVALPSSGAAAPNIVEPSRLADSRPGQTTSDGSYAGFGKMDAGSTVWLQVAGRAGVPASARSVTLNVAVAGVEAPGFLTVYDCGPDRPGTSSLNYTAGQTISNLSITRLNADGMACVYTSSSVNLIVDATASFPSADFTAVLPARLMESRAGHRTVDRRQEGQGQLRAGEIRRVEVAGRGGLPSNVESVVVNLASVAPRGDGFMTAFDCGSERPTAANLNYVSGGTISRLSVVDVADDGSFCLYSSTQSGLLVDVFGYFAENTYHSLTPSRLLESRTAHATVDGEENSIGRLAAGETIEFAVAGRAGVPSSASSVMVHVVSIRPSGRGFVTMFGLGSDEPLASNLNYMPGVTVGNSAIVPVGENGKICLTTSEAADIHVDVVGWFDGPNPGTGSATCAKGGTHTHVPGDDMSDGKPYTIPPRGQLSAGSILTQPQTFPPHASGDGTGNFRIVCRYSHMAYDDPIVLPGQAGFSHLHTFFGNTGTNANSTYDSLRTTGDSTCDGGTANRSSYWVPSLINGTQAMTPSLMFVYYKSGYRSVAPNQINDIPSGLRMVAGNARAATPQSTEVIEWWCESGGSGNAVGTVPNCSAGGEIRLVVTFPQCWNGRDLDSADHKSHMAYPTHGIGCPSSHPVGLPVITVNVLWDVPAGGTSNMFLASDPMANAQAGASAHGDFFEAWDPTIRNTFTANCIRAGVDCEVRLLGNGQELALLEGVDTNLTGPSVPLNIPQALKRSLQAGEPFVCTI